jgi:hypothetical protein
MQTIDLRSIEDEFVVHFGGEFHRLNAETLAASLLNLSGAIKDINRIVNPEYNIEVYVDAIGEGSFRARIKTLSEKATPLLKGASKTIVLSLLAALIYDKLLADKTDINIIVNNDSYVVEYGDQKVILPKEIADVKKKVSERPEIEKKISGIFQALEKDPEIEDFGITKNIDDERPLVLFPRSDFPTLLEVRDVSLSEETSRIKEDKTDLQIIRAIFVRGKRKWQFVWRDGIKISAPILDDKFFDKLKSHEYVIGTGDAISVLLKIHQSKDEMSGVWMNDSYEVVEVYSHKAAPKQKSFEQVASGTLEGETYKSASEPEILRISVKRDK